MLSNRVAFVETPNGYVPLNSDADYVAIAEKYISHDYAEGIKAELEWSAKTAETIGKLLDYLGNVNTEENTSENILDSIYNIVEDFDI